MWACGDLEMVRHLVQHGAEVNGQDANGETPLMKAAYVGKLAVVQYLVESGANVNARSNNSWTPLMWAAGHLDIVEYLVEQGADIHARDQQGSTPLELAQQYGRPEVVKYLQGRGAGRRPRKQNLAEEWPPPGKQLSGTDVSASTLASTR